MKTIPRSTRALYLLADNPDGLTNAEIYDFISATEPNVTRKTVNATMHVLIGADKVRSTGTRQDRRFFLQPDGLIDRRTQKRAPKPPRVAKKRGTSAPTPTVAPIAPAKIARDIAPPAMATKAGPMDSSTIARDIAAFKRNGGRIEKLPAGASAAPLNFGHAITPQRPGAAVRALIRAQVDNL